MNNKLSYTLDIDIAQLREQKMHLFDIRWSLGEFDVDEKTYNAQYDAISSVMHLLDEIQEQAFKIHGLPASGVFGDANK